MSGQNTSHAVMAQRVEPHNSLDDFPTPPWATRAVIRKVLFPRAGVFDPPAHFKTLKAWEPCCNRGYMARPMAEHFGTVHTSDVHDYREEWPGQQRVCDFLFPCSEPQEIAAHGVDFLFFNPPFRLAEQFAQRAMEIGPRCGVAMIVRTAFLEGVGRHDRLFKRNPPSVIAQFAERVPMVKGRCDGEASTATAYCWLLWIEGEEGTEFVWIPPCRAELEQPGDYEIPGCDDG